MGMHFQVCYQHNHLKEYWTTVKKFISHSPLLQLDSWMRLDSLSHLCWILSELFGLLCSIKWMRYGDPYQTHYSHKYNLLCSGMNHSLDFAFGLLGNVVSFMVFVAPLPTFYEIYKRKSTQGFQSVPYVVGLFSALLWIYYALLKTDTTLLITINSVGCFIQATYICLYLFYAPKRARTQTVVLLLLLNGVGMGLIVLITHFLGKASVRATFVGWICLVFSLCVFIAPLCVVRRVIRTKSVEYMPFLLSFFLTLSAVMWFFYGLLRKDYNIAIPNVLGFTLGVVQMVLYLVYRKAEKVVEPKVSTEIVTLQMEPNNINNKKPSCPDHDHHLKEQIIDVVTLTAVLCPEIIPVEILDQDVKITILESDQKTT